MLGGVDKSKVLVVRKDERASIETVNGIGRGGEF